MIQDTVNREVALDGGQEMFSEVRFKLVLKG